VSDPPAGGDIPRGIAAAITEVSERATLLVREEIELAKAEVTAKATKLARGAVIGAAAGVFLVTALFFFLIGCAWLLYYYLPGNPFTYFWGFFAMAAILLFLGLLAGLIAARAIRRGAPPTPDMAIEEARRIRDTVSPPAAPDAAAASAGPDAAVAAASAPHPPAAEQPSPAPYGAAAAHAPEGDA
jgi:Putative Actinobacterial Holin-X, holin superfamily III